MPASADLTPVRIVFASGSAELNRDLIERVAPTHAEFPLLVVAEFEPTRGEWVPWHLFRGFEENLASVRAAIGDRPVHVAAMVLCPGVPLAAMRRAARTIAGSVLDVYNEQLQIVRGGAWVSYGVRWALETAGSPRAKKWLRRIGHPREAEIPLRARAAQIYGVLASRLRGAARDEGMIGNTERLREGVSIVVPSRNGRKLLEAMLPPLLPQIGSGEIIVSDNGSDDGSADWLAVNYPEVRVIRSEAALSFAKAVNAGVRAARFTGTLLLNNDMVVETGFIEALSAPFKQVPNLFCSTAQIFFPAGVRREETGKAVWRQENPGDFPVRCDDPIPGEDLSWVLYGSGGCSLYDTEKLRALGGVSELFDPAYVEDLDLGYRAWKQGWPSVFCASARVEHRHRATTSRYYTSGQLDVFVERNYLRFLAHAVSAPELFRRLWLEGIRRLQLKAMEGNLPALQTLRLVPKIGPRALAPAGPLTETEILALSGGDVAVFPGRASRNRRVVAVASPFIPFPLSHGGAVRIYNLMKQAAAGYDQVLIAFADELSTPPPELLDICAEVILVRRHGSHYRRETPLPDVVAEFASEAFRAALKQTVRRWRPELVQLEFTQMARYADDCQPAKTILVEHDITFDLQQQLVAANPETGPARLELEKQLGKWVAFETAAWKKVDCVVTMSQKDVQTVSGAKRVVCLPNGVDAARFAPARVDPEPRRLLFIGSFAHLPNLLALEFFLKSVWPLLGPGFTLHVIAGARHDYFLDFHRNRVSLDLSAAGIELEGFVADVRSAYERAELVLAPLTASAGTNIKVFEAMAMGRVVVSTPAGINGLDLRPGVDLVVTESAKEMAEKIEALCGDPENRKCIERQARETALLYDWGKIAAGQQALYDDLAVEGGDVIAGR